MVDLAAGTLVPIFLASRVDFQKLTFGFFSFVTLKSGTVRSLITNKEPQLSRTASLAEFFDAKSKLSPDRLKARQKKPA